MLYSTGTYGINNEGNVVIESEFRHGARIH